MSRIKDYIELEDSVLDAAEDAAHHEDVRTRLRAIQHLFEAIGEHVNRSRFHDKPKVVGILVRRAAETYVNARRELHADMRTAA